MRIAIERRRKVTHKRKKKGVGRTIPEGFEADSTVGSMSS
jgi:hypothetical protein